MLNTQDYYITDAQYQVLNGYITNDDQVGFYVALHGITGSEAALDMAEISSSSGLRGGVAWALNSAMLAQGVPGYPTEGVESFSQRIAVNDFNSFGYSESRGQWTVPSDLKRYEGMGVLIEELNKSNVVGISN